MKKRFFGSKKKNSYVRNGKGYNLTYGGEGYVRNRKISIEDARKMLTFYNFELRMSEQDVKNLAADQDFMIEAGMLKNRIDIRKNMIAPIAFEQK